MRAAVWVVAFAAGGAVIGALAALERAGLEVAVAETPVGEIPSRTYRLRAEAPGPTVVVAHGFAGSQRLMEPLALTLAKNGYTAVTFDFPGHGRNPRPFPGTFDAPGVRTRGLVEALADVAEGHPGASEVSFVGHSMASDIQVAYALSEGAQDSVRSTVAISPYIDRSVTSSAPANLLVLYGAWEPDMLAEQARAIVRLAAPSSPEAGVTYGSFENDTARRFEPVAGVEHIGILFSEAAHRATLGWLDQVYGRASKGVVVGRGLWLSLLFLGLIALAYPLSRLLPRIADGPRSESLGWVRFALLIGVPAVLTPLILSFVRHDLLPILLGDYLGLHFGLYGVLTGLGLAGLGRRRDSSPFRSAPSGRLVLAVALTLAYTALAIVMPIDRYFTSLVLGSERLLSFAAISVGTLVYFWADEWLLRGSGAPRGASFMSKVAFFASLVLAIALNLSELFFLVIIVPAIIAFFAVFGLLLSWQHDRTGHPLPGVVTAGLAFAWAIAAIFPMM